MADASAVMALSEVEWGGGGGGPPGCPFADWRIANGNNNNNNYNLYSSKREIKAVVRLHNEEHISIILSHETDTHTHSYS